MIKRFIVICITIISSAAFAQQGTGSPYSFYGIGSLKFKGTVENRSMGGMSVYLDSIHFNLKNPASYAGNPLKGTYFNGESRPVKFTVAGTMTESTLKSDSGEANTNSTIFDYLAVAVPLGKFGLGFGLLPYTSVGYRLDDVNDESVIVNRFNGEGGLNRVFAGLGYQITEKLSVGMDFNYNFGNIQNVALEIQYTPEGDVVQYQTSEFNRSDLSGLNVNFGLNYKTMITDKLELSTTATYAPGSKLNSDNTRTFSTVTVDATTLETTATSNRIEADLGGQKSTKLTLPATLSFGVGVGDPKSWFVGTEYTYQSSADFSNPVFPNQNSTFENSSRIAVGGFFIPDYNAFSGYLKRVVYRAGFNFANTGLVVKDESIKEFGISFGLGLPVGNRNMFSNANLGLEFGKRGTTNQNLIQENFINLNVSLSLNSRWFEQKKYN
ncbi:putative outer membrane protein [Winogradskyella psychrotolerans RS-3]|uniref:Putative outer membrane protein n=1 Tax=Winogradskyella psychrotolerans RS-3 TaxID=641526 RepID=S7XFS8_9FLAO|nr:outer membrane protein [Winogradskyella psychrotolerans]EPR74838.1 putative outer membrane protein [Winogradskyella psychrotolerans RS-3]